jgi:hypothetical protein
MTMSNEQSTAGSSSGQQMQCPRCHTTLPVQAQFCGSCGLSLKQVQNSNEPGISGSKELPDLEVRTIRVPRENLWYFKPPQQSGQASPSIADRITQQLPCSKKQYFEYSDNGEQRSSISSLRTTQQLEAIVPVRSSTVRPIPSVANSDHTNKFWPTIIIGSAIAAALVALVVPGIFVRPFIIFWFLSVCPGMMLVPYFHVRDKATIWTLALALSFTIDALLAAAQLYARIWSPSVTLAILIILCLGGSIIQLVPAKQWRLALTKRQYRNITALRLPTSEISKQTKTTSRVIQRMLFALLIKMVDATKFWSSLVPFRRKRSTSSK